MDGFEELLKLNMDPLERFVKYRVGDKADADDIIQETYLAAFKGFSSLKDRSIFKAWIIGIARNKCNDYFREKAKSLEIPLDSLSESSLVQSAHGLTTADVVRDTLDSLGDKEKQILYLYYFKEMPQQDITKLLGIPLGTVKSRIHTAKNKFKEKYPYKPKGDVNMKIFPEYMPQYKITEINDAPFAISHRELPGMFIVPAENESLSFAMYDFPGKKRSGRYDLKVTGKVTVHGIDGVEIKSVYSDGTSKEESTVFAQLTDKYCRYLGGESTENGIRRIVTFLDEEFSSAYGIGRDNCGFPVERISEEKIVKKENGISCDLSGDISDIAGRYTVMITEKEYDTVRLIDIQNGSGGYMLCEYYLDHCGRTVLWRRFNSDRWAYDRYGKTWSEMLPDNERLTVNGETFVHWYDCITDYIL